MRVLVPGTLVLCGMTLLALSGCVVAPPMSPAETSTVSRSADEPIQMAAKRHSRFLHLKSWKIHGRLGIRRGNEGFSAAMLWQQKGENFDIALLDPLGRRVAQLLGNDDRVVLVTVDGKRFEADNAEELLDAQLGWSFPVQSLLHWVKGTPNPRQLVWRQEYDDLGRLIKLRQGKWTLNIKKYQNLEDEYIPKLIKMERKDIKVKLLIRDWE